MAAPILPAAGLDFDPDDDDDEDDDDEDDEEAGAVFSRRGEGASGANDPNGPSGASGTNGADPGSRLGSTRGVVGYEANPLGCPGLVIGLGWPNG